MGRVVEAGRLLLEDVGRFSEFVVGVPLRRYQLEPVRAVVESVRLGLGLEFLLVFPRQSGKNEAVAQLLVFLLNLFRRRGGSAVFAAIGDGKERGLRRLEERLENTWNGGRWWKSGRPLTRGVGEAGVVFMSSHPNAQARGETADWLLVVDEMQEQFWTHLEQVFEPMRAANNATAVYLGTVGTSYDALWLKKKELELLQERDGRRRVFVVSPDVVSADNPAWGRFLDGKIGKFGRQHPIVMSEYFNEPIDGLGGLFDGRRLALMRGDFGRLSQPEDGRIYLATLDIGGIDEGSTDAVDQMDNPGRDYSVGTMFEVASTGSADEGWQPSYRAVDVFVDQGGRHFDSSPGRPSVAERFLAWLNLWGAAHVVVDGTGVGGGLADWLRSRFGRSRVTDFKFSRLSKAGLMVDFLSVIETGRFKYFASQGPEDDSWWFFRQCEGCSYLLPPGGRFERDLSWGVPDSAAIEVMGGRMVKLHDDRLVSAALVSVYDGLVFDGSVVVGRAVSAVIRAADPVEEKLTW